MKKFQGIDNFFNRRLTKPRRVTLTSKQPAGLRWKIPVAFLILLTICTVSLLFQRSTMPETAIAATMFYIVIAALIVVYVARYGKNTESPAAALVRRFIRSNGLFTQEQRTQSNFYGQGKDKTSSTITSSMEFSVLDEPESVVVIALKKGDAYTDKASQLGDRLAALFELPLTEMVEEVAQVKYVFRKAPLERLKVGDKPQKEPANSGKIALGGEIPISADLYFSFAKNPHVLVAGSTGSGKSFFLFHLVLCCLEQVADLRICDPKSSDLSMIANIIGEDKVATTRPQIAKACREVKEIMERRYTALKGAAHPENFGKTYKDLGLRPVVLLIDEYGALQLTANKEDKAVTAEINSLVSDIAVRGREAGVILVICLQHCSAENLGGNTQLREQFSVRIGLGDQGQESLRMMFGSRTPDPLRSCATGQGYALVDGMSMDKALFVETPFLDLEKYPFLLRASDIYKTMAPYREKMEAIEQELLNLG